MIFLLPPQSFQSNFLFFNHSNKEVISKDSWYSEIKGLFLFITPQTNLTRLLSPKEISFLEEAMKLIEIAEKMNLKIFVDHTFVYTGAVRKIKEIVDKKILGNIMYFDSVRINLGLFQHDVNVIWDLACHDFSIMDYTLGKKIIGITSNGIANYYEHENIAHIAVYFEDNCFAHFHVNWLSPVKIRRTLIGGQKKMLLWDDMLPTEKIKVYDSGVDVQSAEDVHKMLVQYRTGDMYSPKVNETEALSLAVSEFIAAINENRRPLTNGEDGLRVVKILEAAEESIKNKGKFIELI